MLLSYYYRMLFCEKPDSNFSQHALVALSFPAERSEEREFSPIRNRPLSRKGRGEGATRHCEEPKATRQSTLFSMGLGPEEAAKDWIAASGFRPPRNDRGAW
ncbi:MAG: hypothetical protein IOC55_03450 [Methylobacterium sp.]|nr:hypothetical protein [Methylobacterium sp.]